MKRFLTLLVALIVLTSALLIPVQAQEAPSGTWLGTWPYVLLPDHNLNGYASGGLNTNLGNVYRGIVELTPTFYLWASNEYVPILAESWGFTEDNTGYDLTLRQDALWSNGSQINADDLITTYALGRIVGWSQFTYIDSVEKTGDFSVRFHFIDGNPSLLAQHLILKEFIVARDTYGELATQALDVIASGAASDSEEWVALRTAIQEFRPESLIASGPYTYTLADVSDSYMTLRWQPNSIYSGTVQFGEIRLWAGETESTTPLVLSGELAHSTNVYPPATMQSFQEAGIDLVTIPRAYGPALLFNHDVYPWNVTAVRQATALVINREQSAFLTNGVGATATRYMAGLLDDSVPVLLNQEDIDQLDPYAFDPARAEAILTDAGFARNADGIWADADGNTISGEYKFPAEFADFSGAAQDAIGQMNAFGFDITARALPWQESAADIRAGNFELSVWSWAGGSPFAARQFFGPIQRFNYVGLTDEPGMNFPMEFEWNGEMIDLNAMINNSSAGLDEVAQRELAGEVALILNELMPFVPLNIIVSVEPFNTTLISGKPAADDPILLNPTGSDHFLILYILEGRLGPVQ